MNNAYTPLTHTYGEDESPNYDNSHEYAGMHGVSEKWIEKHQKKAVEAAKNTPGGSPERARVQKHADKLKEQGNRMMFTKMTPTRMKKGGGIRRAGMRVDNLSTTKYDADQRVAAFNKSKVGKGRTAALANQETTKKGAAKVGAGQRASAKKAASSAAKKAAYAAATKKGAKKAAARQARQASGKVVSKKKASARGPRKQMSAKQIAAIKAKGGRHKMDGHGMQMGPSGFGSSHGKEHCMAAGEHACGITHESAKVGM